MLEEAHTKYNEMDKKTIYKHGTILIILGGDVGGGKSTHLHLLVRSLNSIGLTAAKAHIKGFHFLSRLPLMIIVAIHLHPRFLTYIKKWRFSPIRILIVASFRLVKRTFKLISLLNLIDIAIITFLRQYVKSLFYKVIVVEDHLVGYVNDFLYFMHLFKKFTGKLTIPGYSLWLIGLRLLYRAAQKNVILFLHAPYSELVSRHMFRGTPIEYPAYIAAGRAATKLIKNLGLNLVLINTSGDVLDTHRKVLGMVRLCLSHIS